MPKIGENVAKTKHAYSILTNSGIDILVHIGVDTVEMNGEGFETFVKEGQNVAVGDTLVKIDIEKRVFRQDEHSLIVLRDTRHNSAVF